jgi:WD40 repeat protein
MKAIIGKSIAKPIILIKILNNKKLLVIDNETTVRFFVKETLELKGGFKAKVIHKHYATPVVAFSNNAKYLAFVSANEREAHLFNTQSKKLVAKVTRHQGMVSAVGIDPLSRYMFSGGEDGKTFAVDVESGKLVFTLPPHSDTINDIAFSENGNWIAVASYDRKISIFNMVTMTPKDKLKAHSSAVMKLMFFDKNKLLSIDKNSSAIIWDIYTTKVIKRLEGIHDDVRAIAIGVDERILFLGTKLGYVLLYNLETYEQISNKFIKITSPITAMVYDVAADFLIVGTADGFIQYYDIFEGRNQLREYLRLKDFSSFQKHIDANPLLVYTEEYKLLSNFWETSLEKAKRLLQKGDIDKAKLILKNFTHMPAKNRIIQKLMKDYQEFPKFLKMMQEGKLALAYGLVKQFPVYKETQAYKKLEERWKKALSAAQKYALDPKTVQLAKDILAPYRGVSEKTMYVQDVLTKVDIYKRFREAMAKKQFKVCFDLINKNPFLKELPEYNTLMNFGDSLYIKAQKHIEAGEIHDAIKILNILQDFDGFENEARTFMRSLEQKSKFFDAVHENDLITAYEMMDREEDLLDTKDGKVLQEKWNQDISKANHFAARGDIKGVREILREYEKISSKSRALGTIYAFTYLSQLEDALFEKVARSRIENGIKNYILDFGLTEQIEDFFNIFKKEYPETKLNLELLKKGSLSMWKPAMIVDSILE